MGCVSPWHARYEGSGTPLNFQQAAFPLWSWSPHQPTLSPGMNKCLEWSKEREWGENHFEAEC